MTQPFRSGRADGSASVLRSTSRGPWRDRSTSAGDGPEQPSLMNSLLPHVPGAVTPVAAPTPSTFTPDAAGREGVGPRPAPELNGSGCRLVAGRSLAGRRYAGVVLRPEADQRALRFWLALFGRGGR